MWQRIREYAVPPSMIKTASERRAIGDWAGACAAARIDVDLDLRAVRDDYGADVATRLRADLRRLAPDLLRWHMPRIAPDGRLRPGLTISLARYRYLNGAPPQNTAQPHLVVRTPPAWADAGQRMSLALWEGSGSGALGNHPHPHPDRRFRLDLHRHLWDSERSRELTRRCGASGPSFAEPAVLPHPPTVQDERWAVARWAAEAELLLRAENCPLGAFTVRVGAADLNVFELFAPDDSHAPTLRLLRDPLPPQEAAALPLLPEAAARVLPDLALLRAGLVTIERMHPLVAEALSTIDTPISEAVPAPEPGDPHQVGCRGEVHRIELRGGVLTAIDHNPAQLRREELLAALGGPPLPCLRAIDALHRNPEVLPAVRERLGHGDFTGALTVVEGLLGPGAILRDGPLRDELESAAARRVDHGLFRSGLAATRHNSSMDGGENDWRAPQAKAPHRPRLDRRTPPAVRLKRNTRARSRTGLA
ncbi:Translation initiation factor 2 [Stackebrandtia soli]